MPIGINNCPAWRPPRHQFPTPYPPPCGCQGAAGVNILTLEMAGWLRPGEPELLLPEQVRYLAEYGRLILGTTNRPRTAAHGEYMANIAPGYDNNMMGHSGAHMQQIWHLTR